MLMTNLFFGNLGAGEIIFILLFVLLILVIIRCLNRH